MRRPGSAAQSGWTSTPVRILAMGLVLAVGLYVVSDDIVYYISNRDLLFDAHAYWMTGQDGFDWYARSVGQRDAFLYSPAFAQALTPFTWLPWPVFATLWAGVELGLFIWLLRPLGWAWTVVALVWSLPELLIGNVYGFLAVALVLALTRAPQAWCFPLLTKPTLGVGLVWHVARREWRALALATATTGAVVAVSVAISPGLWGDWIQLLTRESASAPRAGFWLGIAAACVLIAMAAWRGWPWVVPFALLLALPQIGGPSVVTLLAAAPRLWVHTRDGMLARPSAVAVDSAAPMEAEPEA